MTDGALGLGVSRCGLKVQLLPEISDGVIGVVPFLSIIFHGFSRHCYLDL